MPTQTCEDSINEELKRLRDIQRLLQAVILAIGGSHMIDSLNLEEKL